MPALFRGVVICNGCGATASATVQFGAWNKFWWDLPEGWELHGSHEVFIYCKPSCNKNYGRSRAEQVGKRKVLSSHFDPRTIDKITELITTPHPEADAVLSAIEAVLVAWRRRESSP